MQKEKKKKYSKPEVKKISFDAKTSVLASCKIHGGAGGGPGNINCRGLAGSHCFAFGS